MIGSTYSESTTSLAPATSRIVSYCCTCRTRSHETSSGVLQQCSRCKITRYCSRECQEKHHSAHKQSCKLIAKLLCHQKQDHPNNNSQTIVLAHATFMMAYESCDLPHRGGFMFEVAYERYLDELKLLLRHTWTDLDQSLQEREDHVLVMLALMLITLERHDDACSLLCLAVSPCYRTLRSTILIDDSVVRIPLVSCLDTLRIPIEDFSNRPTLLILMMVLFLRLSVQHKRDEQLWGVFQHTQRFEEDLLISSAAVDCVHEYISGTVQAFIDVGSIQKKLANSLKEAHFDIYTMLQEDGLASKAIGAELFSTEDELQMFHFFLLQDLVLMMPGVSDELEHLIS